MFIVHWYVTSKALVMIASGIPCYRVESEFCSGIASLAVPNLEGKHWPSMQNKFAYQGKPSPLWRGSCIQWLVCFIRNKSMGEVSSRENVVRLDLFTRVWAVWFVSSAEIALPQIKLRAGRARITICNLFVVPARMCCTCVVQTFRKVILSAFLLLCSHGAS